MSPPDAAAVRVFGVNRRVLTLTVALVPILVFGMLLATVRVPFVSLGPGPTFNTLGEYDGKQVVDIHGTDLKDFGGQLDMTTVSQRDGLTLAQALILWLSGREQIVPRAMVFPPDKTKEDVQNQNNADFKRSEDTAAFAALDYLKYPMAPTVVSITEDGAAKGHLEEGDAIDAVDAKPVTTVDEFTEYLKTKKLGDEVVIDYRRKNAPPGIARVKLGEGPEKGRGYVGVAVRDAPWAPFAIDFNLANVGGPSAGLMFALAVVDKLTPGELSGGKFVAGTGTITPDGEVGPIGGITHKILAAQEAGAAAFLVPAGNCAEAKSAHRNGMELVKVETLTSAVGALNAFADGGDLPRC